MARALILVDLQPDFMPGGALAVPNGYEAVPFANLLKKKFNGEIIVATQDWHPRDHGSFASNHPGAAPFSMGTLGGEPQMLWPDHCVQGTPGAALHPDLDLHGVTIFRKGTSPSADSYSGFYDNRRKSSTGLNLYLQRFGVDEVHIMGLATDYCVKFTALDSVSAGFETHLWVRGCFGVNMKFSDSMDALKEMEDAGVFVE